MDLSSMFGGGASGAGAASSASSPVTFGAVGQDNNNQLALTIGLVGVGLSLLALLVALFKR